MAYICWIAISQWPRGSRKAFLCLGCFGLMVAGIIIINRMARPPFGLDATDAQILIACVMWGAFITAAVGVVGVNES
jgi:hypothetical protein